MSTRIARRERGRPAERIVRFSLHDGKAIEVGMSVALGEWLAAALGADDAAPRRGRPAKGAPA